MFYSLTPNLKCKIKWHTLRFVFCIISISDIYSDVEATLLAVCNAGPDRGYLKAGGGG